MNISRFSYLFIAALVLAMASPVRAAEEAHRDLRLHAAARDGRLGAVRALIAKAQILSMLIFPTTTADGPTAIFISPACRLALP